MEVKINREIRNYTEAMFFGLSIRILQIQLAVFCKHGFFLREQNIDSFTFARLRLFHNLGNFLKDFFLLAFVRIVAVNTEAAKSRRT